MQFDPTFTPNRNSDRVLGPKLAAMMDRAFYSRRSLGQNVQFLHEDGTLDEWSFNSIDRAQDFAAKLDAEGREWCFSQ